MKLSIVIPAFNEEKLLPACLESVRESCEVLRSRGWGTEVIVCDNNSTDRTPQIAESFGARVVFEKINQIGRARNTGAGIAGGEWLLFVDADSLVTPRLFEDLAEMLACEDVIGGGACISIDEGARLAAKIPVLLCNTASRLFKYAAGSFLFCRRAVFERLGGFNLELYAGEELDLSYRIKQVARKDAKRFTILSRGRLRTSMRKLELYSMTEWFMTLVRMIVRYRGTTGNRDACFIWYDGRR